MKRIALILAFLGLGLSLQAQNFVVETNKDSVLYYLKKQNCSNYPTSPAEIFYEKSKVHLDMKNGVEYTYEIAYKVYNAAGIGDLADIVINLGNSGTSLRNVTLTTYNLEDDKVVEQTLSKGDIIKGDAGENTKIRKFSIPGVKDGSIVVYKYVIFGFMMYNSWTFQKEFPVAYSRFDFFASEQLLLTPIVQCNKVFKQYKSEKKYYNSEDEAASYFGLGGDMGLNLKSWTRRDVPPFVAEPLMGNKGQYIEKVNIYFNGISTEGRQFADNESWEKFNKKIYESEFKEALGNNNSLKPIAAKIAEKESDSLAKAKAIFRYVQKEFSLTSEYNGLSKIESKKTGNQSSINKYLCALLRAAGFQSDFILLANKERNKLSILPYNSSDISNVVVRVNVNNVWYVIDGSNKFLPFGSLSRDYYNGYARVVNQTGDAVNLSPQLALDASDVVAKITADSTRLGLFDLEIVWKVGAYTAEGILQNWSKDSTEVKKKFLSNNNSSIDAKGFNVKTVEFSNLDEMADRLTIKLKGNLDFGKEVDKIILDPYFIKAINENVLSNSHSRKYPVEQDMVTVLKYTLMLELNEHYTIKELPKSANISFGDPGLIAMKLNASNNPAQHQSVVKYFFENGLETLESKEVGELSKFFDAIIKLQNSKVIIDVK